MRRSIVMAAAALAAASCAPGQEKAAAEAAVVRFHHMLDAGDYGGIYRTTSPDFRRVSSEREFTRILQAIHERLGTVAEATPQGWRVNYGTGGNVVVLDYATRFASGSGTENFVFKVNGQDVRLAGYHVNSNDLMLAPAPPAAGNSAGAKP